MSKRTKLLLKENNELENRLKRDDEQALTNITVYIRSANISPYFQAVSYTHLDVYKRQTVFSPAASCCSFSCSSASCC